MPDEKIYPTILITLDATAADETILAHIRPLARLCGSRLVLLHVADGWAARQFGNEAVSKEVADDRAYLARRARDLAAEGFSVTTELAFGEPAKEIIRWVTENHPDLVAMSTHGHKLIADLVLGTTVHHVRHGVEAPLLLVRAKDR